MEIRSYNHELEIANLLFSKLFRNITIERRTKNTLKQIPVTCIIGNRSRIFKDLENPEKKATYTFPMIVVERTGISTEPERIANLHNEIKYQQHSSQHLYDLMTPNPVAINYSVYIISKNQGMNDMIMSNFIPFFNKDVFVSCVHPKFTNIKYNSQVIMDSSIQEEHPDELAGTDDDFIVNTCSFTLKTFLFGGTAQKTSDKYVKQILSVYYDEDGNLISSLIDSVYEGFLPLVQRIQLDMHAVPYLDPTLPAYQTSTLTKTYISADEHGDPILDLSGNYIYYNHTFSVDVPLNPHPRDYYAIDKYFADISANPALAIDVDTLRWYLNDEGKFVVDTKDYWNIGHD